MIVASHLFMLSALLPTEASILFDNASSITFSIYQYAPKLRERNPVTTIGITHSNNLTLSEEGWGKMQRFDVDICGEQGLSSIAKQE
ncbi:hypothetical protein [Desulfopila sp. IMCC35006]|uniref:hypothetical protein n=1 Tax=Desulfopila sp. IMCC35006 TaxID=2569542 RepID=UPI00142F110F|nr:hypothetical protein [Desulfopila sp. IMCC35006]